MTATRTSEGDDVAASSSPTPLSKRELADSNVFRRSMVILVVFLGLYTAYFFAPKVSAQFGPPTEIRFDRSIIDYIILFALFLMGVVLWIYEDLYKSRKKKADETKTVDKADEETGSAAKEESGIEVDLAGGIADEAMEEPKQHPLVKKYLEKRRPYLDSIKVWLIVLVVFAHTTMSTGAQGFHPFTPDLVTNSANPIVYLLLVFSSFVLPFAMSIFFFISGIFTPRSAKSRTFTEFLNGKFKRLVFPTILVYLALGPLSILVWDAAAGNEINGYAPNFVTMWFLIYLAIFNLVYAFVAYAPVRNGDKTLQEWFQKNLRFDTSIFLWLMAIVGVVDACATYGLEVANVKFIRAWGYGDALPGWLFYFLLGCFAGQQGWMKRFFEERSSSEASSGADASAKSLINCCWYCSPVFLIATIASVVFLRIKSVLQEDPWNIYEWIFLSTLTSVVGFVLIVMILDYASRKLQSVNLLLLCMMKSAYAVYVFHEVIMNLMIWLWIVILRKGMGYDLVFDEYGNNTTELSNGVIVLGWVFVSILTQLIVWPFAYFVRKLPILNQIL